MATGANRRAIPPYLAGRPYSKTLGRLPQNTMGWRMREARLELGLTGQLLADRLGLSKSFICLMEEGRSQPSVETLVSVAKVLGLTLDYLFAGVGPKRRRINSRKWHGAPTMAKGNRPVP